jgi:hypothetical protein
MDLDATEQFDFAAPHGPVAGPPAYDPAWKRIVTADTTAIV